MKNSFVLFCLLLFFVSSTNYAYAHSGRTDAYGCHNCYTSYCYGEYHCHNGGYVAPPAPRYILPAPITPENGNWTYKISSENWCNYDLDMTWDKPATGDRFSIVANKYAGGDPGNLVDTTSLNYMFKNLAPGRWYVNMKTGNSERWGSIVYWTVDLPKPTPSLNAEITTLETSQYLKYDLSCLEKVEGVQEFIDYLNTNNKPPSGEVLLSYTEPTTIALKGWDFSGKEYSQTLNFTPLIANTQNVSDSSTSDKDYNWWLLIPGGILVWAVIGSIWNKIKKR
jgi:hypothetical protein